VAQEIVIPTAFLSVASVQLARVVPEERAILSDAPTLNWMSSTQRPGWAWFLSLRSSEQAAVLPQGASARAEAACFDLAPLPAFASLVRLFSFSILKAKSSRRSEIDLEDVPKSLPALGPFAHRLTQHQRTPWRESLRVRAWEKFPPHGRKVNRH
jgi:hypothetical protein